jgi:ankyrin repeat protein
MAMRRREQRAVDALRALIALGADIDEATDEGNTAPHIAASKRLNAVVGFLARAGAVVYSRPMDDRSTTELLRQLGATE